MSRRNSKTLYIPRTPQRSEARVTRHIADLGLTDRDAYRAWCLAYGFGPAIHKSWRERDAELVYSRKLALEARFKARLDRQVCATGFRNGDEYSAYCSQHGRHISRFMSDRQLTRECRSVRSERAESEIKRARKSRRRPDAHRRPWCAYGTSGTQRPRALSDAPIHPLPRHAWGSHGTSRRRTPDRSERASVLGRT